MDENNLSPDEIKRFREFLVVMDEVQTEAAYRAALRLVIRTWKGVIIALAAIIAALVYLRAQLVEALQRAVQ